MERDAFTANPRVAGDDGVPFRLADREEMAVGVIIEKAVDGKTYLAGSNRSLRWRG